MTKKERASDSDQTMGLPSLGLRGSVSPELVARLRAEGRLRTIPAGEEIYKKGAKPAQVFLIISGKAIVIQDGIQAGELDVGELAGITAMVFGTKHTSSARAFTECEVYPLTALQLQMNIRNTDAGSWIVIYAVRRADSLQEALVDRTQTVTNLRERVGELERRLLAKTEEITTDLRPSLERALQESGFLAAEKEQLKERNEGQATGLAKLNDENARLEQVVRDHEAELVGLRTDLSAANKTLVETEQLRHQATRLMQEQLQRAEAAEADLAKAKETLVETSARARGLAEELVNAKMDAEDALRQRGEEQKAKLEQEARANRLQTALDESEFNRITWAQEQRAQEEASLLTSKLLLENLEEQETKYAELKTAYTILEAQVPTKPEPRVSREIQVVPRTERIEIRNRLRAHASRFPPPIPPDATARDLSAQPAASIDPPSDTQRNRPIFGNAPQQADGDGPALELDLSTMPGIHTPTSPRTEGRNARKETMVLDSDDPDVQIEVELSLSTPPPQPK